jgi:molecular chaperone GrpE
LGDVSQNSDSGGSGQKEEDEDRLDARLADEKKKSGDLLNRLKYLQADFENYRKRTDKEMKEREDSALRGLMVTLLSALDELELAIENSPKEGQGGALLDGLKMVHKKLAASLGVAGLSRIDCVGKPFDPKLHEAVERVQGAAEGEDVVSEEIRPGYLFKGRVIRPSMVKVELAARTRGEQETVDSE